MTVRQLDVSQKCARNIIISSELETQNHHTQKSKLCKQAFHFASTRKICHQLTRIQLINMRIISWPKGPSPDVFIIFEHGFAQNNVE